MDNSNILKLKSLMRNVPDYPIPGINFFDITTILKDSVGLKLSINEMYESIKDMKIDKVAGTESRGFIFGVPLALKLGVGFIPIRKPGKLPAETISKEYSLEYGTNKIEIHKDAVSPGENILLVDDLIATGGTAKASVDLIKELGGNVPAFLSLVELKFLNGRELLEEIKVISILKYN
ncbi:adenine phosphoribosyltransferase [archaeon]|jgi:adenine phosphoribosyltransferase|nr:adenine phosphoribosyltransferase [archaeon]MBT4351942.1 adenine phosphoribosyltransferase [archaeon]MBT4646671.1 adenine phosphoribosyltransferase [archaeon]MBT6821879.1 adenine phosphoribosyltransferase [archaeon]MBT7392289.1 adenine phosphoribosyltransferase [archaeon]